MLHESQEQGSPPATDFPHVARSYRGVVDHENSFAGPRILRIRYQMPLTELLGRYRGHSLPARGWMISRRIRGYNHESASIFP